MPKQRKSRYTYIILFVFALLVVAGAVFGWQHINSRDKSSDSARSLKTISVTKLVRDIIEEDKNLLILDLRPGTDFASGHIPDSVSLPHYELSFSTKQLSNFKDTPTVLVCSPDDCDYSTKVTSIFNELNFSDVKVLEGGFAGYKKAGLAVVSEDQLIQKDLAALLRGIKVPEASVADFSEVLSSNKEIQLIDTRTSFEFISGFIPGAIDIPLHSLDAAITAGQIKKDKPVYVYDRVGNRAMIAAQALIQKGFTNVFSIEGGIESWKKDGHDLDIPKGDGSDFSQLMPLLKQPAQ